MLPMPHQRSSQITLTPGTQTHLAQKVSLSVVHPPDVEEKHPAGQPPQQQLTLVYQGDQLPQAGPGFPPHKLYTQFIISHYLNHLTTCEAEAVNHPQQQRFEAHCLCHVVAPHILTKEHKTTLRGQPLHPSYQPPGTCLPSTRPIKKKGGVAVPPLLLSSLGGEV
jgi:hypothetical protein